MPVCPAYFTGIAVFMPHIDLVSGCFTSSALLCRVGMEGHRDKLSHTSDAASRFVMEPVTYCQLLDLRR